MKRISLIATAVLFSLPVLVDAGGPPPLYPNPTMVSNGYFNSGDSLGGWFPSNASYSDQDRNDFGLSGSVLLSPDPQASVFQCVGIVDRPGVHQLSFSRQVTGSANASASVTLLFFENNNCTVAVGGEKTFPITLTPLDQWQDYTHFFMAPAGATSVALFVIMDETSDILPNGMLVDNIVVRAPGDNAVVASGFFDGLDGWTCSAGATFNSESRDPYADFLIGDNGSAQLVAGSLETVTCRSSCIAINDTSADYVFGTSWKTNQFNNGFVSIRVDEYLFDNCAGPEFNPTTLSLGNTDGNWHHRWAEHQRTTAQAVRIELKALTNAGGSINVQFDDVFFSSDELYSDSFGVLF
ncbi:MAG: hypothetical protein DHS20C11_22950 [Lysobacteraceae bacterium]|nr:MAG: hypothetical protein DHS20C11_22950 [Xanthomonadaceae bacterium]